MVVALLGPGGLGIHAVGRALGRALDASVVDGDRLRSLHGAMSCSEPLEHGPPRNPSEDGQWLEVLCEERLGPRARPHVLATFTSLSRQERRALRGRCAPFLLVVLRDPADPHARVELDEHTVLAEAEGRVEAIAARVYRCLVARLEQAGASVEAEGISRTASEDVCSERSG